MRKIYHKYFDIPEEGKGIMGENVFFARLAVSIACIVLCMSAMGFSAYAYFTASVSSSMNQIQAANFDLDVQKIEPQTETSSASCESENMYTLQAGVYDFVLTMSGDASTGYCQIVVMKDATTEGESVFTRQFGKSTVQEGPVDKRIVQIEVEAETIVKFIPCWGTFNVEEKDRFDEDADMIVVGSDKTVACNKISTSRTVGVTNGTVADTPVVTSESTTTSTPSEIQDTTATEPATSTEITTPTETIDTQENTKTGNDDKKDNTITESIETEDDTVENTEQIDAGQ